MRSFVNTPRGRQDQKKKPQMVVAAHDKVVKPQVILKDGYNMCKYTSFMLADTKKYLHWMDAIME